MAGPLRRFGDVYATPEEKDQGQAVARMAERLRGEGKSAEEVRNAVEGAYHKIDVEGQDPPEEEDDNGQDLAEDEAEDDERGEEVGEEGDEL